MPSEVSDPMELGGTEPGEGDKEVSAAPDGPGAVDVDGETAEGGGFGVSGGGPLVTGGFTVLDVWPEGATDVLLSAPARGSTSIPFPQPAKPPINVNHQTREGKEPWSILKPLCTKPKPTPGSRARGSLWVTHLARRPSNGVSRIFAARRV